MGNFAKAEDSGRLTAAGILCFTVKNGQRKQVPAVPREKAIVKNPLFILRKFDMIKDMRISSNEKWRKPWQVQMI